MKKNIKKIAGIFYVLVLTVLVLVALVVALSTLKIPGNIKLLVVESGSMEPTIKTGSIVLVKPEANYKIGDVITVYDSANHKVSITHRIYNIALKDGQNVIITKGDANKTADTEVRHTEDILGREVFSLPLAGYAVSFAKTQLGLIALIIIPAVVIICGEVVVIKNEIVKLIVRKRTYIRHEIKMDRFFKISILVLAASLVSIGSSKAFYSATETSNLNLSAATWDTGVPPTPGENRINLDFYLATDHQHVGFKIMGTDLNIYDSLDYLITFDSDQTTQAIAGTKTIGEAVAVGEPSLFLGYASSNGAEIPYTGVKNIQITLTLKSSDQNRTFNSSI